MAASVAVLMPILVIFFLAQRYFVEGVVDVGRQRMNVTLMSTQSWPLGVCALPDKLPNRRGRCSTRITSARSFRTRACATSNVSPDNLASELPSLRMLMTTYDQTMPEATQAAIRKWVEGGGVWIAVGGTCGLSILPRCQDVPPAHMGWGGGVHTLGEGYSLPHVKDHPIARHRSTSRCIFQRHGRQATDATVLANATRLPRPTDQSRTLFEKRIGKGRAILIAIGPDRHRRSHPARRGVTRDGVAAADGTSGPLTDGVLKSDDGQCSTGSSTAIRSPAVHGLHAFSPARSRTQWKELLLRGSSISPIAAQDRVPAALALAAKLPAIAPSVARHRRQRSQPPSASCSTPRRGQVNTTWCVILPGYDAETSWRRSRSPATSSRCITTR